MHPAVGGGAPHIAREAHEPDPAVGGVELDRAVHVFDRNPTVHASQVQVGALGHEEPVADRPRFIAAGVRTVGANRAPRRLQLDVPNHRLCFGLGTGTRLHPGAQHDLAAIPTLDADPAVRSPVHGDGLPVGGQRQLAHLAVTLSVAVVIVFPAPGIVRDGARLLCRRADRRPGQRGQN